MSDPVTLNVVKGMKRVFALRLLQDGSKVNLTGLTLVAGIERDSNNAGATGAAWFQRFRCTGHGTHGTLSGTVPTFIGFTGAATLRVWSSGPPTGVRTLLVENVPVKIRVLSSNWLTG